MLSIQEVALDLPGLKPAKMLGGRLSDLSALTLHGGEWRKHRLLLRRA